MAGWIVAGVMTLVAAVAVAMVWRYHRRQLRRLRNSHQKAVRLRDDEHRRQLDRVRREHQRQLESAHHPLAEDLFPVIDALEEAAGFSAEEVTADKLEEGLQIAHNALKEALKRHDITSIEPQPGDPFDPEIHEAISRTQDDASEPNTIRQRFRRGYRTENRVLRPAMVEVNTGPDQSLTSEAGDSDTEEEPESPPPAGSVVEDAEPEPEAVESDDEESDSEP